MKDKRVLSVPVAHANYKLKASVKLPSDALGMTTYKPKTIAIGNTVTNLETWCLTFWHEYFHAVFTELGYESDSCNESKVEAMAHAMMRLVTEPNGKALLDGMLKRLKPV